MQTHLAFHTFISVYGLFILYRFSVIGILISFSFFMIITSSVFWSMMFIKAMFYRICIVNVTELRVWELHLKAMRMVKPHPASIFLFLSSITTLTHIRLVMIRTNKIVISATLKCCNSVICLISQWAIQLNDQYFLRVYNAIHHYYFLNIFIVLTSSCANMFMLLKVQKYYIL